MHTLLVRMASGRMRYWLAVIAVLQVADALLTTYLLTAYHAVLYEASPLSAVAWDGAGLPGLLALKCVGIVVIGLIMARYAPRFGATTRLLVWLILSGLSLIILANSVMWVMSAAIHR